jgi:DNA (cytosine-5)-methyltransferase 1
MTFTAVDLFCGAGGFSSGLERAGVQILGALDCWRPAVESYRSNFSHPVIEADASATDVGLFLEKCGIDRQVDIVVGGPPCQGFSIQRIGADSDNRNDLILEFARFVRGIRPRMFVMENVPGLLGKRGIEIAAEFQESMTQAGYTVMVERIDAADFGVPQSRRRVLFIGWLRNEIRPFHLKVPVQPKRRTVMDAIADLPSPASSRVGATDPLHWRTRLSALNLERLAHIPPGGGFENLPVSLRVEAHKAGADRIGHRNVYGRLHPDRPANTITAKFDSFTRGKFAHPLENRNITLREGARLQSFDDGFEFCGTQEDIAALIGNAVPPLVAFSIGQQLVNHLEFGVMPAGAPVEDEVGQIELVLPASATIAR